MVFCGNADAICPAGGSEHVILTYDHMVASVDGPLEYHHILDVGSRVFILRAVQEAMVLGEVPKYSPNSFPILEKNPHILMAVHRQPASV